MTEIIKQFQGEHRFLSNFWECPIVVAGSTIKSVEHGYQAAKAVVEDDCNAILALDTPGAAKRAGKKVKKRPEWEMMKLGVMIYLVTEKFVQNVDLAEKLLATGDAEIQEGNYWGDTYWGVDLKTGEGENNLGKILMNIRDKLRDTNVTE